MQNESPTQETLSERLQQLLDIKQNQPESWNDELAKELAELEEALAMMDGAADPEPQPEKKAEKKPSKDFSVPKGAERKVWLKIRRGTKFDPQTGKPIGTPYVQAFSYGEWKLFQANHTKLGYVILEVLHDPYGEAKVSK